MLRRDRANDARGPNCPPPIPLVQEVHGEGPVAPAAADRTHFVPARRR